MPIRSWYHLDVNLTDSKWMPNGNSSDSDVYTNWHPGQPDLCCGSYVACAQMDSGTGLWFDTDCSKTAAVACKSESNN